MHVMVRRWRDLQKPLSLVQQNVPMIHVGGVLVGGAKGSPHCGFIHHLHTFIVEEEPFIMTAYIADVMPCNMAMLSVTRFQQSCL